MCLFFLFYFSCTTHFLLCVQLHTKVQMLKNTRDYSFLLSDDAELPAPSKDPPRSVFPPKSGMQLSYILPGYLCEVKSFYH